MNSIAELEGLLALAPSLLLHVVRVGAFFAGQPMFGAQRDSRMLRAVLALALGVTLFWVHGAPLVPVRGVGEFAWLLGREVLVGVGLGLVLRALSTVMTFAGEVLSHEMGFTMAQVLDPATGRSQVVLAQLLEVMAVVMLFQLDLHHEALRAFAAVYDLVPVGAGFSIDAAFAHLRDLIAGAISAGMSYALPVLGVMVLLTAVLVVMARAVPHINLLEFAYGVRILLALLASVFFLVHGAPFLERVFADTIDSVRTLFAEV